MSQNSSKLPAVASRAYRDPAFRPLKEVLEKAIATNADPQIIEGIKTVFQYENMREDYTLDCTSQESDVCRKVTEFTMANAWEELKAQGKTMGPNNPRMLSGRLEGQFLKSLISAQRARRVLDVGMYTGYSALAMAEALPAGGELVTLDRDPYLKELNEPVFKAAPQGAKITIKIGSALENMKKMAEEGQQFDFIFLDADKSEYIDYLNLCLDKGLLAENGTIAVDNAFMGGKNYLPSDQPPTTAQLFSKHVIDDKRLHKVLVPIRDGIIVIRRLSEVERDLPQ